MRNTKQAGTSAGEVTDLRNILENIVNAGGRCRELARLCELEEAQQALSVARALYAELRAAADLENPIHCSIVRNRGFDMSAMVAEVESCRLKVEKQRALREKKKARV